MSGLGFELGSYGFVSQHTTYKTTATYMVYRQKNLHNLPKNVLFYEDLGSATYIHIWEFKSTVLKRVE